MERCSAVTSFTMSSCRKTQFATRSSSFLTLCKVRLAQVTCQLLSCQCVVPARCCGASRTVKWGSSAPEVPVRCGKSELKNISANGKWFHPRLKYKFLLGALTRSFLMKVMNLLLSGWDVEKKVAEWATWPIWSQILYSGGGGSVPVKDAHGRLPVFDESHPAVAVPLVLDGHAADLHHHLPKLLGRAPALFRTRELLAGGGQELPKLSERSRGTDLMRFGLQQPPLKTASDLWPISNNVIIGQDGADFYYCFYLDVGVVHDKGRRHLQSQVIVLPPVQHEGDALLPDHLTQRHICTAANTSATFERDNSRNRTATTHKTWSGSMVKTCKMFCRFDSFDAPANFWSHRGSSSPGSLGPCWPDRGAAALCCPRPPSSRAPGPPAAASRSASPAWAWARTRWRAPGRPRRAAARGQSPEQTGGGNHLKKKKMYFHLWDTSQTNSVKHFQVSFCFNEAAVLL